MKNGTMTDTETELHEPYEMKGVNLPDGTTVMFYSIGTYWSGGRTVDEIAIGWPGMMFAVDREWMLDNTSCWRDYSPTSPQYDDTYEGEPWSESWMIRAAEYTMSLKYE